MGVKNIKMEKTEQLYRKVEDENGNIEYIPAIDSIFYGEPKEGIWLIRKDRNGRISSWISSKVAELPEVIRAAQLEPLKSEMARRLHEMSEKIDIESGCAVGGKLSIGDIISTVFHVVRKGRT